jgi:HlyD family secretion protein
MQKARRKWILGSLIAAVLGAVLAGWWFVETATTPELGILDASGWIEGDQVAVGAKVGGTIVHLPVREGQTLQAGDVIAELSSEQVKAQLEQAEHELHTAREEVGQALACIAVLEREVEARETAVRLAEEESRARIGKAEVALEASRAQLPQAEAELHHTQKDLDRYQQLLAKDLIAPQQVDEARAAYQIARATDEVTRKRIAQAEEELKLARVSAITVQLRKRELAQARKRLRESRAASGAAKARVQTLEARRVKARADVKDTRILAPFDGTVLQKLVQEGQVVAAGTPLVTFVDMAKLYVKVYLPEKQIAKVRLGNPVRVYVDAFPKKYFEASVSEVSQQAEFTPRDVHMKEERVNLVFAVKLALDNPRGFLKPGMPADAKIRWKPQSPWGDGPG